MTNSLIGSQANDNVGGVTALDNGSYVVINPHWDLGLTTDVGAISWGLGEGNSIGSLSGPINGNNSVIGLNWGGGYEMGFLFDEVNNQLVVLRPDDHMVTLFRLSDDPFHVFLPVIKK